MVSDPRYVGELADECPDVPTHIRPPAQKLPEAVAEVLNKLGCRRVGFESGAVTVAEHELMQTLVPAAAWRGVADRVEKMRVVKDEIEIKQIRESIRVADRAFTVLRSLLRPDDREKDLCDALDNYIRRCGGEEAAFPPIVLVGERSALPHAPPSQRAVSTGDVLLVDWGAQVGGYKCDLTRVLNTRTFSSSARGDEGKLEQIHAVVAAAQAAAIAAIRPGAAGKDVDAAARQVIGDAGYGDYFGHGLGHGFGLQIHEAPTVRPDSNWTLEAGMVCTVEPGIYLPDWGGVRLEDDVLVAPEGCEVLTSTPRDLETLKAFR
jgi:Xaa-Pro aminopeptidase